METSYRSKESNIREMPVGSSPKSDNNKDISAEMTIRGLRVFVAVEETGSIYDASKRIGYSPSGVSQHISKLELAIGTKLFDRKTRPITLTPSGQILRVHAHRILNSLADAQTELAELNLAPPPRLSLAIIDDMDASLTPVLVENLQHRFSNCFVSVSSGGSDDITQRLDNRDADIILTTTIPKDHNSYNIIRLLRDPFVLIAAKGLFKTEEIKRDFLENYPFVEYSEAMPIGKTVSQHMKRARFKSTRRFSFDTSISVFAMLVRNRGWTIATPLCVLDAEKFLPELDIFKMPFPAFSRSIYLISRTGEMGHLPDQLADLCRDFARSQILPRFEEAAPSLAGLFTILEE